MANRKENFHSTETFLFEQDKIVKGEQNDII